MVEESKLPNALSELSKIAALAASMGVKTKVPPFSINHAPVEFRPQKVLPNPIIGLTKDQLEVAKGTQASIAQLVELTNANVELAKISIDHAQRSGRFSRLIAYVSIAVAIASLAVAIVSLAVAVAIGTTGQSETSVGPSPVVGQK